MRPPACSTEPRAILLACDDYSAVSGKVPLWQLYERGRSLGIGVQVSAQSWHGLGDSDDERYRIAATADGGIWLMRTPHPEPVSQLAGTRQVIETATKVIEAVVGRRRLLPRPARLDRRPRHRPPPHHRAGRLHHRRRLHLGLHRQSRALAAPDRARPASLRRSSSPHARQAAATSRRRPPRERRCMTPSLPPHDHPTGRERPVNPITIPPPAHPVPASRAACALIRAVPARVRHGRPGALALRTAAAFATR